jgi:galactose mutarotase-like enzyme
MTELKNELLRLVIADKGAELQQLYNPVTGINYLWNGNPAYWGKFSPVLFPVVGGLKNESYVFGNKSYQLPRHGFARDKYFKVEQISNTEAAFTLTDDAQTKEVYPFAFRLRLIYRLQQNSLSCTYEVYNPGNTGLLFSIGAHPAFAVPLVDKLVYGDYYLSFNQPEKLYRHKLINGLIDDRTIPVHLAGNKIQLEESLFYEDAIVLKNLQSNQITLASNKSPHGLHFRFNGFDFFGIWAAKDAPFVCLEPWCGIADGVNHNQQLIDKEGIQSLKPCELFTRSWSVECF